MITTTIIIEGPPASGKTTLISKLSSQKNPLINVIPEFGETKLGEFIRQNIKKGSICNSPIIETYLLFCNLLQKQQNIKKGKVNIFDTYLDSIRAHQIPKIGKNKYLKVEKLFSKNFINPDFIFYLLPEKEIYFRRLYSRQMIKNVAEKNFFGRVFNYYKKFDYLTSYQALNNINKIIKERHGQL